MNPRPADALQARAKRSYARIQRLRRDPRYARVLGKFKAAALLETDQVEANSDRITISDALWAGQLEPRILELLPALVIKKPSLFEDVSALPDDLSAAVRSLRRAEVPAPFRGIPGADLQRWLPRVGHRNKLPSRLKSFRFRPDELALLQRLSQHLGLSETDTLRRALYDLAKATWPAQDD